MNAAVILAMRPALAGQATDRRPLDGVGFPIMPGKLRARLGVTGVLHETFTGLTLAADR